jgi:sialic acid synthase SpsE
MLREIGGRRIGPGSPVFVIAEIGLNHGGSAARALELVDAAAAAGASAIKLQTLVADKLVAPACPAPAHVKAASLQEFFSTFELDWDAHRAVMARARKYGLAVMTTPFAEELVQTLQSLQFDAYKIASGDVTYDGLISAVADTSRPVVISSGMSDLEEIGRALRVARRAGAEQLAILHCVSAYPAPVESQNLRAVKTIADAFGLPTGLSDHGSGLASAAAAVALGAVIYERHLVLEHDQHAIDRAVSSTPAELKAIVQAMDQVRLALGTGVKVCQRAEAVNVTASRRGLYAARTLRAGEVITRADVVALRPASSMAPSELHALVGYTLSRDVAAGSAFSRADVGVTSTT